MTLSTKSVCVCFDPSQLSATRHLITDSDTELISEIFGMELAARRPAIGPPVTSELLFEVVQVRGFVCCYFGCLGGGRTHSCVACCLRQF